MRTKTAVTIVAIFASCCIASGQEPLRCNLGSVEGPKNRVPIGISQLTIHLDSNVTQSSLYVQNASRSPVNALVVLVNFYKRSQYLLSAAFYAGTRNQQRLLHPAVPYSPIFTVPWTLRRSLLPSKGLRLSESIPLRPLECPDAARIVLIQVIFAKGMPFVYRSPEARTDPILRHIAAWPLRSLPTERVSVVARVGIDEVGQPELVSASDAPDNVYDLLFDQIKSTWKFLPAIFGDAPIASEMCFLFRFNPTKSAGNIFEEIPIGWNAPVLTVVDVALEPGGDAYLMSYGSWPIIGQVVPALPSKF